MITYIHTTSSLNCWLTCQQKYNYIYELGYRTSETIPAYLIGTAVHLGLEYFWEGKTVNEALLAVEGYMNSEPYFKGDGWIEKLRIPAYIAGYYHRWLKDRDLYEVIGVELEFQHKASSYSEAGKLDVLVRRKSDGKLVIIEHKTASKFSKASEPGSAYWQKLSMDTQMCFYHRHIQKLYGEEPEILYDVVIKSKSAPLKGKARKRKGETDAEFAQRKYDSAETPSEYRARIKEVYRAEGAERYIRKTVHLTQQEVDRKMVELDSMMNDIMEPGTNEAADDHWAEKRTRIRNTTACSSFGGACEFLGVCTGLEQLDDPKFEKKEKLHSELTVKETQ